MYGCGVFGPVTTRSKPSTTTNNNPEKNAPPTPAQSANTAIRFGFAARFNDSSQHQQFVAWCAEPHNRIEVHYESKSGLNSYYFIIYAPAEVIETIKHASYYRDSWTPEVAGGTSTKSENPIKEERRFRVYMPPGGAAANNDESRETRTEIINPRTVDNDDDDFVDVSFFVEKNNNTDEETLKRLEETIGIHFTIEELQQGALIPMSKKSPKPVYTTAMHITGLEPDYMRENYPVRKDTVVAILDSGLCNELRTRDSNITPYNAVAPSKTLIEGVPLAPTNPVVEPEHSIHDTDGHGTMMYGIIRSLLPDTHLIIAKIIQNETFVMPDVKNAAIWAMEHGATILCISASPWRKLSPSSKRDMGLVHQKAVETRATICFASGNDHASYWSEGFGQDLPQFHVVGAKDCAKDEPWEWTEYCYQDKDGKAKLKVSHGEDVISYASADYAARFEDFRMIEETGWHGIPEGSKLPLIVASGTSEANAIYTALLAMKQNAPQFADTTDILREILSKMKQFELFRALTSPMYGKLNSAGAPEQKNTDHKEEDMNTARQLSHQPTTPPSSSVQVEHQPESITPHVEGKFLDSTDKSDQQDVREFNSESIGARPPSNKKQMTVACQNGLESTIV